MKEDSITPAPKPGDVLSVVKEPWPGHLEWLALARVERVTKSGRIVREHGIPWDGPTEFLPDQPVARPVPMGEHPWLEIDVSEEPNEMHCTRCGGRQAMPEVGTAPVIQAMLEAFASQHADCEEGDAELVAEVSGSAAANGTEGGR